VATTKLPFLYCIIEICTTVFIIISETFAVCRYEPFDFHKECKAMKWYRLSLLMDRIAAEQQQFGSVYRLLILDALVTGY